MRIVVVEDEFRARKGIINLINKYCPDYEVVGEAENGINGLEVISRLKPDIVIADIMMPEMNGLEMFQKLKELGIKNKTIILSGYSEFEYAQKSIKFGVSDYLLKPVTVEYFKNVLEQVKKEIESERLLMWQSAEKVPTVEIILLNIILGSLNNMEECMESLKEIYQIDPEQSFTAILAYLGSNEAIDKDLFKSIIKSNMDNLQDLKYYIVDLDVYKELVILIPGGPNCSGLERKFQTSVIPEIHKKGFNNIVFGSISFEGLREAKNYLQILRKELKWSITLDEEVLIAYPKTQQIFTKAVQYPVDLEHKVKDALYNNDLDKLKKCVECFLACWRKDLYQPSQIIDSFVRFASSIINVLKEINYDLYCQINQKDALQNIMDALNWYEIKTALTDIVDKILSYEEKDNHTYSLLIKKMLSIISERYKEGITLDEIASTLNVTPEYLGSLFIKEVGKNFSLYTKEYRISKAKELLLNSNYKMSEISREVGYTDAKYFCRVFKEIIGMSAGEYQRKNK